MNLSEAIELMEDFRPQLGIPKQEALMLIISVLKQNVDIEAWDEEYEQDTPMCMHCEGNGCASCKRTGEAIF